jgi:hypothetical protein
MRPTAACVCMRPHTFEMPLQVLLTVFNQPEQTVELPDDATVLTVKEWVGDQTGIVEAPGTKIRVVAVNARPVKVLKDDVLLSSGPDGLYLKLKVMCENVCG